MANNPNPQEFNREVDLNKPAEVDDVLSRPKATEYASTEFAKLVPEKDLGNKEAYAKSPAPAKRVVYTSPEIVDRSKALAVNKWGTAVVQGAKLADSAYKEHVESEIEKVKEQADNFWSIESEEALLPTGNAEPPGLKQDASRLSHEGAH